MQELCRRHHAYVSGDNPFQRRARLLQALWREGNGYEAGLHDGQPLGSRLAMPFAEHSLANYLTETIRDVVRREVVNQDHGLQQLYARPRIFNDLLSSQPLCFNLFGEMSRDLPLGSAVFSDLTEGRVREITTISFEFSPGRGDARYTDDNSAFDVYVEFLTSAKSRGFIGIEVKYHEKMNDKPARDRPRYGQIASAMDIFRNEALPRLRGTSLQQVWRDHLLAGSLCQVGGFADALSVVIHPADNSKCVEALRNYRACLTRTESFATWTLEDVVAAIRRHGAEELAAALTDRYLAFGKIDRLLSGVNAHNVVQ